jgi:hypothetical protein
MPSKASVFPLSGSDYSLPVFLCEIEIRTDGGQLVP